MGGRWIAIVATCLVAGGSVARAQPADDEVPIDEPEGEPAAVVKDPKVAKRWLTAAQQLVKKGDYFTRKQKPDDALAQYTNAVTAYDKAIEAGDDVNVFYELATVEAKLGKLDRAAVHLRVVIKAGDAAKPDVLKKASETFDELSMSLGIVKLIVVPEGATVSLAGAELGQTPLDERLILMPGTYTLSFAAEGFQPKDSEIIVDAGSESERTIELEPIKIMIAPIKPGVDTTTATVAVAPPSRLPLYIGGGAAVGLTTIGIITGIVSVAKHGTFTAADSTTPEREDARSSGQNFALVTDVMLGTAVVAAGFTAYWYFFKYRPAKAKWATEQPPSTIAKVGVVPWVQAGAGGVTVGGSF